MSERVVVGQLESVRPMTVQVMKTRAETALSEGLAAARPAWKDIPSWFAIGTEDRTVPAVLQRFEAERAGARGVRDVAGGSHALAVSNPQAVTETILAAVDLGYHVIVPTDAICSSSDETHDALLKLCRERYGEQIEPSTVDQVLARWR